VRNCASAIVLIWALQALGQNPRHKSAEYPRPLIREEQTLVVEGAPETWRLQWSSAPKTYCSAEEAEISLTCPCVGFAHGEVGDLYVVRLRFGVEVERLQLAPLFGEHPAAVVQRWAADNEHDFKLSQRNDFESVVHKRPTVQVMNFADYDHDGKATEFYLETEAAPCGKSLGVVIGLSTSDPRLHVFGTVANPEKPMYLQKREWEALRVASASPVTLVDWQCFDHAAPTETAVELRWSDRGLDGVRREYTCPPKNKPKTLLSEVPLGREDR
jgi:hypothetical protein